MAEEMSGKLFIDMLIGQFKDHQKETIAAFKEVENDMEYLKGIIMKNKKKIRGMKFAIFGLGIGVAVLASELAERKRSENYLKKEIDELKEQADKQSNYIFGLDQKIDCLAGHKETDGGAADA